MRLPTNTFAERRRSGEDVNLQFHAEFFNVLNVANFALPNTNITARSALPRVIQFALKLTF